MSLGRVSLRGLLPGRRARRWLSAGLAVALAGGVALVWRPADASESAAWLAWSRLDELVATVDAAPDWYAGVSVDEQAGTVTVRYPQDREPAAVRARLAAMTSSAAPDRASADPARPGYAPPPGAGLWVELRAQRYSLAELRAVADGLKSTSSWPAGWKSVVSRWGVDVETNTVVVGMTEVTPAAVAQARRRFGDRVRLERAPRPELTSRRDDFAPWAGGGVVETADGLSCTSAFAINDRDDPSRQRLLTAGHCVDAVNEVVRNNGEAIGSIVQRVRSNRGFDVAYIGNQQYAPFIYLGPPNSEVGRTVRGTRTIVRGTGVCTSGAITGQNCAGEVQETDTCACIEGDGDGICGDADIFTCALARASATDGSVLARPGDSGGPVVQFMGADGAIVVGMIVAGDAGNTYFHPFTELLPIGWQVTTGG